MAYSEKTRAQAVKLALEIGPYHASKELGISRTALYEWFQTGYANDLLSNKVASVDVPCDSVSDKHTAKRLRELERELQKLRRANRILLNTIDALTSKQNTDAEVS